MAAFALYPPHFFRRFATAQVTFANCGWRRRAGLFVTPPVLLRAERREAFWPSITKTWPAGDGHRRVRSSSRSSKLSDRRPLRFRQSDRLRSKNAPSPRATPHVKLPIALGLPHPALGAAWQPESFCRSREQPHLPCRRFVRPIATLEPGPSSCSKPHVCGRPPSHPQSPPLGRHDERTTGSRRRATWEYRAGRDRGRVRPPDSSVRPGSRPEAVRVGRPITGPTRPPASLSAAAGRPVCAFQREHLAAVASKSGDVVDPEEPAPYYHAVLRDRLSVCIFRMQSSDSSRATPERNVDACAANCQPPGESRASDTWRLLQKTTFRL